MGSDRVVSADQYIQSKIKNALRIGICGVGRAGWGMIRKEVEELPEIRIVAGCDLLPERALKLADSFKAAAYTEFKSFLKNPTIDLVIIATRSKDHAPMAIQALKAGKDVMVEKPMALNSKQADQLIAVARKCKRRLVVRHNRRFDPPYVQAMEIIRSGKIGKVHNVQLRFGGYDRRADWQTLRAFGGGLLNNWGPHLVDWGCQLIGSPVTGVWGDLQLIAARGDAEDHFKIIIRGQNGAIADVLCSGGSALGQPPWLIHGTLGSIQIDGNQCRLRHVDPKSLEKIKASPETPPLDASFGGRPIQWIDQTFELAPKDKRTFWGEVYKTLKKGTTFPVSLEEARRNIHVMELARKGTGF